MRLVGNRAGVKFSGTFFNKCRRWEFAPSSRNVDGSASGDVMEVNSHVIATYRFRGNFILDDSTPYSTLISAIGTNVPWAGFIKTTHANPLASSTGLLDSVTLGVPWDNHPTIDVEIKPDGTVVAIDEDPTS